MSTTLTNGLKLPDKGSVDWYADMQNNYQILDGAVGTVAEHTTALSGKAPLVHTHTKADIIDLFNSANMWSANNTYSADCIIYNSNSSGSVARLQLRNSKAEVLSTGNTASDQSITFRDKNDVVFCQVRGAVQSNSVALKIGAYAKDSNNNTVNTELQLLAFINGNKAIIPSTTNAYDLGTSSYKWKTLNGINPGALSLPDSASFVDISSSITNLDGTDNFYTPSVNGWISVCVGNNSPSLSMYCDRNNSWGASFAPTNTNTIFGILPLIAGNRVRIRTVCGALIYARFYPCLGNV